MTATVHKLKSAERLGDCASRTVATQAPPRAGSRLGHTVSVELSRGRSVVRPTFICRTHKAPIPRGHRTYLEVGRG